MSRRVVWAAWLCAASACGRVAFETTDAPTCVPRPSLPSPPSQPFGAPTLIAELDSPSFDDDPTLTDDELEIYFESARGGTSRLWRSVRGSKADPWPAPTLVTELDAANTPEISRDGLRLRFVASGALYLTTRPDRASAWQAPVLVDVPGPEFAATGVGEFLDGAGLVFASALTGDAQLWEATVVADSCAFAAPRLIAGLPMDPKANAWMRNDGLAIVYPGLGTTGASDVMVATRPDLDSPFGPSIEQTAITSTNVDDDPWMNDAMTSIYFMSARTGDGAIYHATR